MNISEWLSHTNKKQADLARLLKGSDKLVNRDRVRAHRIMNGARPNDEEMQIIFLASEGKVSPNDFYKLPRLRNKPTNS